MLHYTHDLKLTYRETDSGIRLMAYILCSVALAHILLFLFVKIEYLEVQEQKINTILLSVEKTEASLPKWYQSLPFPPRSHD